MRTVTIDIINEKALNLLKDLELLKLIRLRKDNPEPKPKAETDWLNYKGTMTRQPLDNVDQQLNKLRDEWE